MEIRRDGPERPWRGVSLGGWLLLEPGPAHPLFQRHPIGPDGAEARCEWDFLQALQRAKGKKAARQVIKQHRDTHITKADFEKIRSYGLNAVRLPIGYWIILGPMAGDPYHGPAIEYVDQALDWAEACGLQVMLDLHGCPGGESGEAPSGRRQRPEGTWKWRQWRQGDTLRALDVLVSRYRGRKCVTGISVCNEPSNEIPLPTLCRYYERAIERVRKGGMPASRIAIVLPLFQREVEPFIEHWQKTTRGKHRNICFDVHCYHCFENVGHGKSLAQQLRAVQKNAEMLREYPMVVGEWSLALGCATWTTCGDMQDEEVYRLFGRAQVQALSQASHGWFFWNWTDRDNAEWNYQVARAKGCFAGRPLPLPKWSGVGEDPLEEQLVPSPSEARVFYGDPFFLRAFYGRYVDVDGSTSVQARWGDKGDWQTFMFRPPTDAPASAKERTRCLRTGDVVRVQAHSGQFVVVKEDARTEEIQVSATRRAVKKPSAEFVLHVLRGGALKHRGIVCLQSRATGTVLDADAEAEGVFARYGDLGDWQQFVVEKNSPAPPPEAAKSRKRRVSLAAMKSPKKVRRA